MSVNIFRAVKLFVQRNVFLVTLIVLSIGLAFFFGQPIKRFPGFIDWDTIITLSGLLIITTGVKESGFFHFLARRISQKINNERLLAMFLIFISALLSMFLTNDIALFIIVPLTLSLQDISESDYTRIVVFEALAVNVGSSLTPIGNPQNIFLWRRWNISFPDFILEMAPLFLLLSLFLFLFVFFAFSSKKIEPNRRGRSIVDRKMFFLSVALLVLFVAAIELEVELYFLSIIFLSFLLFYRNIFSKTDWTLIFLFLFIFIDIRLIYEIKEVQQLFGILNFSNAKTLFFSGAFLSQIISNVPAAILLSHYSVDFKTIAYGVNVGGNGLLIGSFANLIALSFSRSKSKFIIFHLYSIAFFLVTVFAVALIFF